VTPSPPCGFLTLLSGAGGAVTVVVPVIPLLLVLLVLVTDLPVKPTPLAAALIPVS
jgi:hypothetical protein